MIVARNRKGMDHRWKIWERREHNCWRFLIENYLIEIRYDQRGCSYFHFLFSKPYMHWVTYGISNLSRSTPRIIERSTLALSSGKRVSGMSRLVFCKRSWDRFPRASPRITLPECCSGPSASELPRRVSFFPGTPLDEKEKLIATTTRTDAWSDLDLLYKLTLFSNVLRFLLYFTLFHLWRDFRKRTVSNFSSSYMTIDDIYRFRDFSNWLLKPVRRDEDEMGTFHSPNQLKSLVASGIKKVE